MSFFLAMEKARPARADAFRPLPGVSPVPMAEARGCRWPVHEAGDPMQESATHVCGAERVHPKLAYCPVHHRLSVGRGTQSERDAVRAARRAA